jgi:hypothetical protein
MSIFSSAKTFLDENTYLLYAGIVITAGIVAILAGYAYVGIGLWVIGLVLPINGQ